MVNLAKLALLGSQPKLLCSNCRFRKLKWNEKSRCAYGKIVLVEIVEVEVEGMLDEFKVEEWNLLTCRDISH